MFRLIVSMAMNATWAFNVEKVFHPGAVKGTRSHPPPNPTARLPWRSIQEGTTLTSNNISSASKLPKGGREQPHSRRATGQDQRRKTSQKEVRRTEQTSQTSSGCYPHHFLRSLILLISLIGPKCDNILRRLKRIWSVLTDKTRWWWGRWGVDVKQEVVNSHALALTCTPVTQILPVTSPPPLYPKSEEQN